ncbi:MAG: hypothetical protein OXB87_00965 [Hyphomicrobiales bacterium]|nr:hypothetical protein [Hyphomicrobiales bacterium]
MSSSASHAPHELCDTSSVWYDRRLGQIVLRAQAHAPRRFALVRAPAARLAAGYAALRRAGELQDYADINAFCADLWKHLAHPFFAPQHRFVCGEGGAALCPWVREGDAAAAAALEREGAQPFALTAADSSPQEEAALTRESLKRIAAAYHRDFDLFGYARPAAATQMLRVLDAVADARRRDSRAPALVFWSERFRDVYRLWRARHDAFSTRPVVAIYVQDAHDEDALAPPRRAHSPPLTMQLPPPPPAHAQQPSRVRRTLWRLRMDVFFLLMVNAYDFVHFDADAFVLKPYDWLIARQRAPFLFSLGGAPAAIREDMGFTGCCGFFAVRSARVPLSDAMAIHEMCARRWNDQGAFNQFFLERQRMALVPPEHCGLAPFAPLPLAAENRSIEAMKRRQEFWKAWGAHLYDGAHGLLAEILPLALVSRFFRGAEADTVHIWHINRFVYPAGKAQKFAVESASQWQRMLALTPRWQLWLRRIWLRLRAATRRQSPADSLS